MQNELKLSYKVGLIASLTVAITGFLYLILVAFIIIMKLDFSTATPFQIVVNIISLIGAFAFFILISSIHFSIKRDILSFISSIFAGLLLLSVVCSRFISLITIIQYDTFKEYGLLNLYKWPSITWIIESIGWMLFYSASIFFISFAFSKSSLKFSKVIKILCRISALCSIVAINGLLFQIQAFGFIGLIGYGILLEVICLLLVLVFVSLIQNEKV